MNAYVHQSVYTLDVFILYFGYEFVLIHATQSFAFCYYKMKMMQLRCIVCDPVALLVPPAVVRALAYECFLLIYFSSLIYLSSLKLTVIIHFVLLIPSQYFTLQTAFITQPLAKPVV